MTARQSRRVAILVDTLHGGGAEKVCLQLARSMQTLGVEVHLIVVKKLVEYELNELFPVVFLLDDPAAKLYKRKIRQKALAELRLYIEKTGNFDLLLSNLDGAHPIASALGLENTWYVVHNSIEEKLKRARRMGPIKYLRQKGVYRRFEGQNLVAVSQGLKTELLTGKYVHPKKVIQIYNPVNRAEILELARRNLPTIGEPYILHVGRFARLKRHDILFEAYCTLRDEFGIFRKLVLLCEQSKKLQDLIHRYKLERDVVVIGFQQNPYVWMNNSDALVLSSDGEGFGLVLAEAMICGAPVVSTECQHGPAEILGEEFAEYLSPVGDAKSLAFNIKKALECRPDTSQAKILNQLEPENVAKQYLSLI